MNRIENSKNDTFFKKKLQNLWKTIRFHWNPYLCVLLVWSKNKTKFSKTTYFYSKTLRKTFKNDSFPLESLPACFYWFGQKIKQKFPKWYILFKNAPENLQKRSISIGIPTCTFLLIWSKSLKKSQKKSKKSQKKVKQKSKKVTILQKNFQKNLELPHAMPAPFKLTLLTQFRKAPGST